MPRPLWNGSLSFGLVNVPVQLTGATRDLDLHFRQLHKKDGAPIEQRRYCSQDDAEVQWEEVGRGYELDDGKQVVLTDEELASVQPEKTRTIDVQSFVDLEDVDPIYFDNTWFLVPAGDSQGKGTPAGKAGGGPLEDYGIYGLQSALYLTGEMPESISATTFRPTGVEFVDTLVGRHPRTRATRRTASRVLRDASPGRSAGWSLPVGCAGR